ncbi:MAG: M48 family metallopeptidase [Candidatus Bathyarchaeota archaeon]|nr:M48 family metallopeptidase [Candidatus Bathyarchaeota archaeon]
MVESNTVEKYSFNKSLQEKAREYQNAKHFVSTLKYALLFWAGFSVLRFGISSSLKEFALSYSLDVWLVTALYLFIGFFCFWAFSLPFDYYAGYVIEHRFDLSTQTVRSWIADNLKGLILGMLLSLIIVQGIYYALRTIPTYWWVVVWVFTSIGILVIAYVAPVVIMPLFFKYPPLKDQQLIERLTNLVKKAGISVVGIFEMKAGVKTKKAVGALAGVGDTRRIILSDTLLANYSSDEIEGVIGHELGHHVFHHIGKMTIVTSVMMLIALYITDPVLRISVDYFDFSGIDDIASLPLLVITFGLLLLVALPIMNTFSRYAEGQADQYELEIIRDPDAFISCMLKLCDQNLRDADPHPLIEFMLYDHPSGKRRVQRALNYKRLVKNP